MENKAPQNQKMELWQRLLLLGIAGFFGVQCCGLCIFLVAFSGIFATAFAFIIGVIRMMFSSFGMGF